MANVEVKDYQFVDVPKGKLENGQEIPLLGIGTWQAEPGVVGKAVENALKLGYRHVDCAAMYENQAEIGDALHKIFKEGRIKRDDVWITSKLHNKDHDPERVPEACKETLRDLQIEQLDLYLMHWPIAGPVGAPSKDPPFQVTWGAMEKLVEAGLTKNIGVSNFSVKKLEALRGQAHIQPAVQQIEGHPYFRNNYNIHYCKTHGMHVTAYSPLGTPGSGSITHRAKNVPVLLQEPLVQSVAQKHNKHPAQVLIRWGIQRSTSVIPKATSVAHMKSNLEAANWELPPEDFKLLNFLGYQKRMVDGGAWFITPEGPFKTLTDLWDYEEETGWPPGKSTVGIEVK
ncbi:g9238 [Coccomyxa elongata]